MNGRQPVRGLLCFVVMLLVACGGGSGNSPPADAPPPVSPPAAPPDLAYSQAPTFVVGVAIPPLTPTVTGTVTSYAVNPSLPAGLSLGASTGVISGTPTVSAALADYQVTASNAGGSASVTIAIAVTRQTTLLDLGHVKPIKSLRVTSTRVLSVDESNEWALWNYATAAKLASAVAGCLSHACVTGSQAAADLEGPTVVAETAAGLEVRASSDGSVLAVIPATVTWWKLAADGSYLCAGSATALTVWSPAGAVIATRAGDYSSAMAFAAPGQIQLAAGPAGSNVIETVALPSGASTVGPTYHGTFNSWFLDGQYFLSNTANTVWIYTNNGVQADIAALPSIRNLTGQGNWFWTYSSDTDSQVNVYRVGASSAASATFSPGVLASVVPSGLTLGILEYGTGAGTVVDLSGAHVSQASFTAPVAYTSAFGAASTSQWMIGNNWGVLVDGASLAGRPRHFGHGAAWSIAGSDSRVAVATAAGEILYFDASTNVQEGAIGFSSSQIALASDGSVLAAAGDQNDSQYHDDWSINVYSLPSGVAIKTLPYSFANFASGGSLPLDMTFSRSGDVLGLVQGTFSGFGDVWNCLRQVSAVTGGAVLWSDAQTSSQCLGAPIRLSPDGTKVAVSSSISAPSGTNVYVNGQLVSAVPGAVVGWLDNDRILVNNYTSNFVGVLIYAGCAIYDFSGTKLGAPPLPEIRSLQIVSTDSVYDPGSNTIYSTTTGKALWSGAGPSTGVGAVAGSGVVFESGNQVLVQSF